MLGRKTYPREELDNARTVIDAQLAAWRALAEAADGSDPKAAAAVDAIEPLLFNNMALVLDRYFVHRLRLVTGKGRQPAHRSLLGDAPAELAHELLDPSRDLVARGAHRLDGTALGVGQVPVEVALAGDDRALVAAAHGGHDVG